MPEVSSEPFTITGIMVNEPFYFVAGQMHRQLELDFLRVKDFEFYDNASDKLFPNSTYLFFDNENWLLYILVWNNVPIIKSLKTPDILLFVIGRDCQQRTETLTKQLRKLSSVRYCKQYYSSQQEDFTSQEEIEKPVSQSVQLDVFADMKNDVYQSVKRKRKKAVKQFVIDDGVIDNLKEDLEINLGYDAVLV